MKVFFALAFLAAVCAAAQFEPVELPEPAIPYVDQDQPEPVNVVDSPDQGFIPDDYLRVNVVDNADWFVPEDNLRVNVVEFPEPEVNDDQVDADGYHKIAPSELEQPLIDFPLDLNDPYAHVRYDDPTWR